MYSVERQVQLSPERRAGSAVVGSAVAGSAVGDSAVVGPAVAGFAVGDSAVVGSAVAGSAAASFSGAGSDDAKSTVLRLLFCGLPSGVLSSPAGYKKSSGFYSVRPPHCLVDTSSLVILHHRRHTRADVYPTDTSQ